MFLQIFISHFEYFPIFNYFKRYIIGCHRPKGKLVFDIHEPGFRYLFQLRLGLSQLRSHKKSYGFADTPSDTCLCRLGTEDTRHFLFSCPFHATKRTIMVSSVNEILLKNNLNYPTNFPVNELNLYLYGLPTLSSTDNRLILLATIDFIKNTNRFSHQVLLPISLSSCARSILVFSFVCFVLILFILLIVFVVNFLGRYVGGGSIYYATPHIILYLYIFLEEKSLEKKFFAQFEQCDDLNSSDVVLRVTC